MENHFDVPAERHGRWNHIDFIMELPILTSEEGTKEQLTKKSEEIRAALTDLEKIKIYLKESKAT